MKCKGVLLLIVISMLWIIEACYSNTALIDATSPFSSNSLTKGDDSITECAVGRHILHLKDLEMSLLQFSVFRNTLEFENIPSEYDRASITGKAIDVDRWGNSYVLVETLRASHVLIDNQEVVNIFQSMSGCMIIKYDANRNRKWIKMIGRDSSDLVVTCQSLDHVTSEFKEKEIETLYIVGSYSGQFRLNNSSSYRSHLETLFVIGIDAEKGEQVNHFFSKSPEKDDLSVFEPAIEPSKAMLSDDEKSIFIVGKFRGTVTIHSGVKLQSLQNSAPFIIKYSLEKSMIEWAKGFVNPHGGTFTTVMVRNGKIIAVGAITGQIQISPSINLLGNNKHHRGFWVYLDSSGNVIRAGDHSGRIESTYKSVTIYKEYAFFSGETGTGTYNAFMMKVFFNNGSKIWEKELGSVNSDYPHNSGYLSNQIFDAAVILTVSHERGSIIYFMDPEKNNGDYFIKQLSFPGIAIYGGVILDSLMLLTGLYTKSSIHVAVDIEPEEGSSYGYFSKLKMGCNCSDQDCYVPSCNGYFPGSRMACSGRGLCISRDKCLCRPGFTGFACQFPICYNLSSTDPNVCSGYGKCFEPNSCTCPVGRRGDRCEMVTCFGSTQNETNVCTGKGQCVAHDVCKCNAGFTGRKCEQTINYNHDLSQCKGNFERRSLDLKNSTTILTSFSIERRREKHYRKFSMREKSESLIIADTVNHDDIPDLHIHMVSKDGTVDTLGFNMSGFRAVSCTQDNENNLVISGYYESGRLLNVFVMKIDITTNQEIWIKIIDSSHSFTQSKVILNNDIVIVSGYFRGEIHLNEFCFASTPILSLFIVGFDLVTGDCLWLEYGNQYSFVNDMDIKGDYLLFAGSFRSVLVLEQNKIISTKNSVPEAYIALMNIERNKEPSMLWAKSFENGRFIWKDASAVKFDTVGNIIIGGIISSNINIQDETGIYVSKLDSQGHQIWKLYMLFAKSRTVYHYDSECIFLETGLEDGSIFVTGYIDSVDNNKVTFYKDDQKLDLSIPASQSKRYFLMKLDHSGEIMWILLNNSTNSHSNALDVTLDKKNLIIYSAMQYESETNSSLHFLYPNNTISQKMDITLENNNGKMKVAIIRLQEIDCSTCKDGYFLHYDQCKQHANLTLFLLAIFALCCTPLICLLLGCSLIPIGFCFYKARVKKHEPALDILLATTETEDRISQICQELFSMKFNELRDLKEIFSKSDGATIYKGKWKGQEIVAKIFRTTFFEDNDHFQEFEQELQVLFTIRHKNIINFFGAFFERPLVGIVLEYMERGSLLDVLKKTKLSWKRKVSILLDVARGMSFLHSKGYIHRDLKSANVLIDRTYRAKIADFGISKSSTMKQEMTQKVGTNRYMSPEVTLGKAYTEKCDVFSFSILMYEVLTENVRPYGNDESVLQIEQKVALDPEYRPSLDNLHVFIPYDQSDIKDGQSARLLAYRDMLTSSWNQDPDCRPTFEEIEVFLDKEMQGIELQVDFDDEKSNNSGMSHQQSFEMSDLSTTNKSSTYYTLLEEP